MLNKFILLNPVAEKEIEDEIKSFFHFNSECGVSKEITWDAMKAVIRGKVISVTSAYNKRKNQLKQELLNKITQLEAKHKLHGSIFFINNYYKKEKN